MPFSLLESLILIIIPNPVQCCLRVQAFRFSNLFLLILLRTFGIIRHSWSYDSLADVAVIGLPPLGDDEDPEIIALEAGAEEVRIDPADDTALQVSFVHLT